MPSCLGTLTEQDLNAILPELERLLVGRGKVQAQRIRLATFQQQTEGHLALASAGIEGNISTNNVLIYTVGDT